MTLRDSQLPLDSTWGSLLPNCTLQHNFISRDFSNLRKSCITGPESGSLDSYWPATFLWGVQVYSQALLFAFKFYLEDLPVFHRTFEWIIRVSQLSLTPPKATMEILISQFLVSTHCRSPMPCKQNIVWGHAKSVQFFFSFTWPNSTHFLGGCLQVYNLLIGSHLNVLI